MDLDDTYGQVYCLVICHGLRWHIWSVHRLVIYHGLRCNIWSYTSFSGMSLIKMTHMVMCIAWLYVMD